MQTVIITRTLPGDVAAVWSYLSQPQLLSAWFTPVDTVTIGTTFNVKLDKIEVTASVTKLINSSLIEFSVSATDGTLGLIVLRIKQNTGRIELTVMDGTLQTTTFIDKLFYKINMNKRKSFWHSKLNALEYRLEQG